MPIRAAKSAAVRPVSPQAGGAQKKIHRGVVRRTAKSALLAAGLAIAQTDDDETGPKWRLFDPGLLDRLRAPLTRYHE